ncbi:MAG: hypothetical protein H6553_04590 [Chitinophagales bacterium]|nr:hypothetical protein [Chitinophagales bacterium]
MTDEEVKESYYKFSNRIQTNTISAAELEFVIVATIVVHKPQLTEELLYQPLLMLVWSFGNEIDCETVIKFVDGYILHEKAKPYGGIPDVDAVNWLNQYFKNNKVIIQRKLIEVIKKNNEELLKT